MKKWCFLMCLITLSNLLFGQKNFPSQKFEKVLINRLNSGYEEPAGYAGVALKPHHLAVLNEVIALIHESKNSVPDDFSPDAGIYFYNESDETMASLLFSESEGKITIKENNTSKTIAVEEAIQHKLFDIITETLWVFKPVVPAIADTVLYSVPENKTWEQIADSFQTDVALLCEINRYKKDWGLNAGREIIVIPGVKEFRYPAPAIRQNEKAKLEEGINVTVHTVRKRESLYTLAGIYNIPIEKIMTFNNLQSQALNVGQLIYIPD